ncbi:PREDICTED: vegetative cell wall protein gp1-like [Pterocles gutturalis]|uniref:vegetative cell wall protein gp1-like n=1 Tax=Pterocles gutturalis TaxID=240206 RepID=UPI00052923C6|nr:PREDICTED: vegetative cell wall protein gp1-like [Pterocles gutturalis]
MSPPYLSPSVSPLCPRYPSILAYSIHPCHLDPYSLSPPSMSPPSMSPPSMSSPSLTPVTSIHEEPLPPAPIR